MEDRKPDCEEFVLIIGLDSGERAVFVSRDASEIEREKQVIECRIACGKECEMILPLDSKKWFLNANRHIAMHCVNLRNFEFLAMTEYRPI